MPDEPGWYQGIPGWGTRDRYVGRITGWLLTPEAEELCRQHKLHDRVAILTVAVELAKYADHDTGRRCAPAYDTIAANTGLPKITVRRAEAILRTAGWVRVVWSAGYLTTAQRAEARALTGRTQVRSGNVRALTIPRDRAVADDIDGPSSTGREHLPATRAGKSVGFSPQNSSTRGKPRPATPRPKKPAPTKQARPLKLQQLAAAIDQRLPMLGRTRHIGALCDALSWAGIELHRWGTAPTSAANRLIDTLTRLRRIPTANQSHSPIGWLHSALAMIDPDQPTPYEQQRAAAEQLRAAQAAAAAQTKTEQAAAIPLAESTAADQIRAELRRIAAKPRRGRDLPIL